MTFTSKLPNVGTTIFSVMAQLSQKHQAINLAQGFPNFDCPQLLKDLVNQYTQAGYNQYAPMAGVPKLRQQLADKIHTLYQNPIDPEHEITITAGATQAIFTIITTFVKAGDEVILIEPAYDSYRPSIEVNGGIPVIYELAAPDYRVDWEQFAALISPRTKLIIFNTPHNPTGTVWDREDILALQNLVADKDILVLSDEVYEHLTFDGKKHESALAYPDLYQKTFATFSFGKTFHSTGWKMGYCVAPKHLMAEFRKVHQFNVFSVNTPVQYAIADFLEDPSQYLNLADFYQQKRDLFLDLTANSRFRPIPCAGTYFQLMDYSAISEEGDFDFAKRITEEYRIATIPVSVFYSSGRDEKVVRFCFAKTPELLKEAGRILEEI